LIVGLSLTALANVVNASDRFDSDAQRVDVIEQIDHQAAQMNSSKNAGQRPASTKTGGSREPAYPYTMPMNR
jgi:hypothetical protein